MSNYEEIYILNDFFFPTSKSVFETSDMKTVTTDTRASLVFVSVGPSITLALSGRLRTLRVACNDIPRTLSL